MSNGSAVDPIRAWPTDIHIHIQPWEEMKPSALRVMRSGRTDHETLDGFMRDPGALVAHLDSLQIGRVALINYVAPEIMGFSSRVNEWGARYRDACKGRVLAFGGIHPPACTDVAGEMRRITDELGLDGLKIHPPHQNLSPDAYRDGTCPELATVYEACSRARLPIMFHTGTSVFPGARSRLGGALVLDDVAVDFPELTLILAHGGRPLWMDEAFFMLRRHPNVYMDISGIPPRSLLEYFPRLEEVAAKALYGTDWPSPGVRTLDGNLQHLKALPLEPSKLDLILRGNALKLFPPRS